MTEQEKIDYVARFGHQSNVIRLVFNLKDRLGIGTEYLTINGALAVKYVDNKQVGPVRDFPVMPKKNK